MNFYTLQRTWFECPDTRDYGKLALVTGTQPMLIIQTATMSVKEAFLMECDQHVRRDCALEVNSSNLLQCGDGLLDNRVHVVR